MKRTRLFTFLIASIFALALSAQGIVVHQGNSKKVSFKSTDVQKIEFTEDLVENSTDNYVEKSELEDLLGKLRDEINLKLDRADADKIWKEIERILGLCSELNENKVDKSTHEIDVSSLRKDIEEKASRSDLDKALKKIDELSDLVKDLQSKIGTSGGSGGNTGGSTGGDDTGGDSGDDTGGNTGGDNTGGSSGGTSTNNEHEYVDLGLSVKWATMNVGASSPEDYGDYFAWGETKGYKSGKTVFSLDTYKYYLTTKTPDTTDKDGFTILGTTTSGYTKYVTSAKASSYGYDGFYDNKTVLDPADDAATANWGGSWRMPTEAEQDELRNNCTWEWKELKGVKGYKVTGSNGNYIFLPAAGCRYGSSSSYVGSYGYYWSSSLFSGNSDGAIYLHFGSSYVGWDYYYGRFSGQSVRAVCP